MSQEQGDLESRALLSETSEPDVSFRRSSTLETEGSPAGPAAASRDWKEHTIPGGVRAALYGSHFLSTWGQRGWEFAVGLILLELHPTSLLFVSLFGLLDAGVQVVFGAAVGSWVDRTDRLVAAQRMYLLQNSCVAVSAAAALALLYSGLRSGGGYWACLATLLAGGCASSLGALGSTLSVEREWTKVLCAGRSDELARMNAVMRRIDLTCLIGSPVLVGAVMTFGGGSPMAAATLLLLAWNMLAWAPECALLVHAQRRSPALAAPKPPPPAAARGSGRAGWRAQADAWVAYFRQPAAPAALALALLYLTVMSFGSLMTAYLKWTGMPEAKLSVYRGLGAVSGIAATVTFSPMHRRLGLVATGAVSVWLQLACVAGATLPALLAALGTGVSSSAAARALVAGLVLSRFGLWSFDLAVNQLIQELVPDNELGAVNGVQGSLQSLFQMLSYVAGAIVWQPERFPLLMTGSCAMVAVAACVFTAWAALSRSSSLAGSTGIDARAAAADDV